MELLDDKELIFKLTLFHAGGGRNPPPPPSIFHFTVGMVNKCPPNHFVNTCLYVIYIIEILSFSYHMSFCHTVTFYGVTSTVFLTEISHLCDFLFIFEKK